MTQVKVNRTALEEIRASKQAVTKVRIVLVDRSVLQVKEYIDAKYKIDKISYAYQYHDEVGKLIFRYDNARHKPDLGFIEHKHLSDRSIVKCGVPDISDVVDEVIEHI
ncbi:MAG: hypothetical protein HQ551_02265 [Desulfobacteraceae bacterium]|nr:hypothetical protein [Desulfobacteraceae bacterium]